MIFLRKFKIFERTKERKKFNNFARRFKKLGKRKLAFRHLPKLSIFAIFDKAKFTKDSCLSPRPESLGFGIPFKAFEDSSTFQGTIFGLLSD